MYLFERVLDRISRSAYRDNFILKGGFLISSLTGIGERTTMDIDASVRGISLKRERIERVFREIISIDAEDGISFEYKGIRKIREGDVYENHRILFNARYGKINNPMKMDITTGDDIIPEAVKYDYPTIFDENTIRIMAYNIETVIAEKYETVIRRNVANTRTKDFYDLYTLLRLYRERINDHILKEAVIRTAARRGSLKVLDRWEPLIEETAEDETIKSLWTEYKREYPYASEISFEEMIEAIREIGRICSK